MPIHFVCPVCQSSYVASDLDAGKKAECKTCGQRLQVPTPSRSKTVTGAVVAPPEPIPLQPVSGPPPLPPAKPRKPPVRPEPEPETEPEPVLPAPLPLPTRRPIPIGAAVAVGFIGLGLLGGAVLVIVLAATQGTDPGTQPVAKKDGDGGRPSVVAVDPRPEPATTAATKRPTPPEPDPPVGAGPLTGEQVFRLLVRSAVLVGSQHGGGTGFVVDEAGRLVVTNDHVVGGERQVAVVFPLYDNGGELVTDSRPYQRAIREVASRGDVVARDPARDLALIRVDKLGDRTTAARLAAKPAPTGASVFSVGGSGADDNLLWRLTKGTVRGRAQRQVPTDAGVFDCTVLETDAPVNAGDSGGPVMNDRGELVAVVSHFVVGQRQVSGNIDLEELRDFIRRNRPGR